MQVHDFKLYAHENEIWAVRESGKPDVGPDILIFDNGTSLDEVRKTIEIHVAHVNWKDEQSQ